MKGNSIEDQGREVPGWSLYRRSIGVFIDNQEGVFLGEEKEVFIDEHIRAFIDHHPKFILLFFLNSICKLSPPYYQVIH